MMTIKKKPVKAKKEKILPKRERDGKEIPKPEAAETAAPEVARPKGKTYSRLRGMHDLLPKDEPYLKQLDRAARELAEFFQFGRIELPLLEEAALFTRTLGRGTDVVEKEMYVFVDRDGTRVALRPEFTAGLVRAFIEHGMWNNPQPVKLWCQGPLFRHDRPQAGRYRQFHQVDFETFGVRDPAVDAELITVGYSWFAAVGLPVEIRVNTLGTPAERERYVSELLGYYRSKRSYLCEDCRARLGKNPLRLLDCKEPQCAPVREGAPQLLDWVGEGSKRYFMKTLEFLDELALPYTLSPYLVRGLDYYTDIVFEFYYAPPAAPAGGESLPETAQSALGGGGRYDLLVEELGGRPTPGAGFALGVERTILALKRQAEATGQPSGSHPPELFFAHLGEDAKRRTLKILQDLRPAGFRVAFNFGKNALKHQLEIANSLKVPLVLILGQKEVQDETVIVRDMESGMQEIVGQAKLVNMLKKKLGREQ